MSDSVLRVDRLSFRYRSGAATVQVLSEVSLVVAPGEVVVVLGPSGCGKSTLLSLVAGLLPDERGAITFAGDPVVGTSRRRTLVPQETSLLPWRTATGNLTLVLAATGLGRAEARARARRGLASVGLGEWADAFPHQLSGGMRQRVSLARALAVEPDLMLLDEPFGALDPAARSEMHRLLGRVLGHSARGVLMVTHDVDEALALADRVVVLSTRPGRVVGQLAIERAPGRAALAAARDQITTWLGMPSLGAAQATRRTIEDERDQEGTGAEEPAADLTRHPAR